MTAPQTLVKNAWLALLASGIAALCLGACGLLWPGPTLWVAAVLFGAYLVVTGIAQLLAATFLGRSTSQTIMLVLSGALSLILGVVALRNPVESVVLLAIWIGVGWLFRGAAGLGVAAQLPQGHRAFSCFLAIILIAGGAMVVLWPAASAGSLLFGASFVAIAVGASEIADAFALRKRAAQLSN